MQLTALGCISDMHFQRYHKESRWKVIYEITNAIYSKDKISALNNQGENKVKFKAFNGVGPQRYLDLFSMKLGSGRNIKRKNKSEAIYRKINNHHHSLITSCVNLRL